MNYFKNLSVRGKIISIIAMMIVLMTIIATVGMYFLKSANNNLNAIVDVNIERIKLAARINQSLIEIHRAEKNLLLSDTKDEFDFYHDKALQYQKELIVQLGPLKKLISEEGQRLIVAFEADYKEFLKIHEQVISLQNQSFTAEQTSPADRPQSAAPVID